jgi:hypothetical protein
MNGISLSKKLQRYGNIRNLGKKNGVSQKSEEE